MVDSVKNIEDPSVTLSFRDETMISLLQQDEDDTPACSLSEGKLVQRSIFDLKQNICWPKRFFV